MTKNILISFGIVLAIALFVFGSYLPFLKARSYIKTINTLSSAKSVQEFEGIFKQSIDLFSPVGEEEIVKFFVGDVVRGIVSQNNPENVARELVSFSEQYLFPNNVRHLLIGGNLHDILWQKYGHREEDMAKVLDYYEKAFAIGPKLPPVLYGLLGLYQAEGNIEKTKEIGNLILAYWPEDQGVKNFMDQVR